ncbi:MAG: ferrous iron transport protein A [Thermoproteota archaeon]|nr:ferrous iron transport protein A [Candidatus Korarchaeota archaeon]RLG43925.1 MAG: ferrous iron transport protein A [Candidatus Korarchaeota archaeon]
MIPLAFLMPGQRGRIVTLDVGRGKARRLMEMGLLPGEFVEVLSNSVGPVVIRVRGMMLAIGRNVASRIWVEVT